MQLSNNTILITGGATGIGLGLTRRFIQHKNTVIVCGRREDVLKDAAAELPGLITKKCDLEDPAEREALYAWVTKEHPGLNILVNNAGIQNWMNITDKDFYSRARQEIAINIEAPLHLTSLFLQHQPLTTVMNVTSGLSFVPVSKAPVYSATKAFFHSFNLSLRHSLKARNIEVIEIIPPALNTDLGAKGIHDSFPPVSDFIEAIFTQLQAGMTELTFGFSEAMTKAGPAELQAAFTRLNP
ncbi:SDR family oxidoreductase [Puia dinghuensis]|uniref:Short-chain dehydrogenase n=1 Tax=Puia dinghuensis TaxID=1792502 RepID=A0A8J2UHC2_9BACT|nr:SDR family NAD(P)-dependent oxidoreductase [Puia dinghuensis]GGB18009.1 short-chain dehydrogenase [Puia dinghuensis]